MYSSVPVAVLIMSEGMTMTGSYWLLLIVPARWRRRSALRSLATSCDKVMRGREQLLITVDGLPLLTEMKSMKSLKCGQSVTKTGRRRHAQGCIVSTFTMQPISRRVRYLWSRQSCSKRTLFSRNPYIYSFADDCCVPWSNRRPLSKFSKNLLFYAYIDQLTFAEIILHYYTVFRSYVLIGSRTKWINSLRLTNTKCWMIQMLTTKTVCLRVVRTKGTIWSS